MRGGFQGGRTTVSRGRQRLRSALVVTQVAISVVLLAGAGLMLRSFAKLQEQRPGFSPDRLVTLRISPGFPPYQGATVRARLADPLLAKVRAVPGVESAVMASSYPFNPLGLVNGPASNEFDIQDRVQAKGQPKPAVDIRVVSADYFETLRQPIVKGRTFAETDCRPDTPPVAIVNQSMARHFWPNEDPIGKRLSFDNRQTWTEIVGIAGDVKEYGLDKPAGDEIYLAYRNGWVSRLIVRTAAAPQGMVPLLRAAVGEIDRHLAIDQVNTVERAEYDSMASPRVLTFLLGIFAGLAVLISGSGIAAMMALAVSQRNREWGLRMALGAQRSSIVSMVVGQGLRLALAGTALGIAGAMLLTKVLAAFLYATSPTDALTFAAVAALFLAIAAAACFIPARQVTAIDPLHALRQE
jgi:predicted permease